MKVTVRWATPDDARGVAIVHVDSWRAAYRGLITDEVLDGLRVDQREQGWSRWIKTSRAVCSTDGEVAAPHQLVVAETDSRIVGWASFGPGRDDGMSELGELAGLYVDPEMWSQRVGHTLLARVEQELLIAGFGEAYLWVLAGNDRAIEFYEQHGWHADGAEKFGAAGGASELHELRHVRRFG